VGAVHRSDEEARAAAAAERVEVVAVDGTIERIVTRAEMRAGNLRHRVVYVAVVDRERAHVLVHQRASWKDVWPDRWDLAFGGIASIHESWEGAAVRELAEESGVRVPARDLIPHGAATTYDDDEVRELARVWSVISAGPFTFPDGEVQGSEWVPVGELDDWLAVHPTCPDTVALVGPHLRRLAS
jgi:isopentenyl-diphosphate delta-isomerase